MAHFTIGSYQGRLLNVGSFEMNANTLFANAPAAELAVALKKHQLQTDTLIFQINPLLIHTGRHHVLIDPGAGDGDPAALLKALRAADVNPASIDTVIITHAHADHYSGCVTPEGQAAFPNAIHYMQRAEWEHWLAEDNPEPYHAENFKRLLEPLAGWFVLLDGSTEIVPGIRAVATPGHSPGHMAVQIGEELICGGDVLLHAINFEHPDWYAAFDVEPEAVVTARQQLLNYITAEELWVYGYHFPAPATGRMQPEGNAWAWRPEALV